MNYPRYFLEIDSITRLVQAAHIITFNAHLEQGHKLDSTVPGSEMLEISENEVKKVPTFPEIVGTYKMNEDNKLVKVLD